MILLQGTLKLVCFKGILYYIQQQVMKKNENNYNEQIEKMVGACFDQNQANKRMKQMATVLFKRMKEIEQNKSKQNQAISIFLCINQNNKQHNCYNESFVMASLLYLFIKFKFIRVNFIVYTNIPKPKKLEPQIKMSLTQQFDIKLTKRFYDKIQGLLEQMRFQIREASAHFQQIKFQCLSQNIDTEKLNKKIQLLKVREDTYQFIYQFYENLSEIFVNKRMYLALNHIHFFCLKENLQALHNSELVKFGQQLYVKKILKIHQSFYINTLVVKTMSEQLVEDLCKDPPQTQQMQPNQNEQNHQYQQSLGYFSHFHGNPFQFLSKLLLIFVSPPDFSTVKKLLPKIPNIQTLKIHKQNQEMVIPEINEIMQLIVNYNKQIEVFWLSKIRVETISYQLLQRLYEQCPYLSEFEISIRFRYLIQQTYIYSSPQEKQIKQNERQCQLIFNALRLRKITLNHNLQMAKILIKKKYNLNQIIQVIDCVQPFCF